MSSAHGTGATELGVVDPIRIPGSQRVRRAWSALPTIGRAFVVVAIVDLLLRFSGRTGLPTYLDLTYPLALVTGFLPHYALLLFPAVLVYRDPDAGRATPLLLGGAVLVALVELIGSSLAIWLSPAYGDITAWAVLQIAISLAGAAGYVALARGLAAVDRSTPTQSLAGLANLVAGLIAGAAIVSIIVQLLRPNDLGDPGWTSIALVASTVAQLTLFAFASLARTILRGTSDQGRPREARILAASAVLLSGIDAFLTLTVGLLVLAQDALHVTIPVVAGGFVLALLGSGFVMLLVVVAFALGLGDVSGRMRGRAGAGANVAGALASGVAWPTPGGEVPSYHPEAEESQA